MAVAGLTSVSAFNPSFLRESQSPESRHWDEQSLLSTRASTLRQLWKELECEHVVGHPRVKFGERSRQQRIEGSSSDSVSNTLSDEQCSLNRNDSLNVVDEVDIERGGYSSSHSEDEQDNGNNSSSDQPTDLGENERGRVRQIFREWINNGATSHPIDASNMSNCERAQWLGENERGRVRVIREWVKMNAQQRGSRGSQGNGIAEICSQIEQVRDGLSVNHPEIGEGRTLRRLCGRQALLDLLMRAQTERKRELDDLLEQKPVSDFPHRNRIQSILRGRFLWNERLIQGEKPASRTANELGMLSQRSTVSNLREGFLLGLGHHQRDTESNTYSSAVLNCQSDEQYQSEDEQVVIDEYYDQSELANEEAEVNCSHVSGNSESNSDQHESIVRVVEAQEQALESEEGDQETFRISEEHGETNQHVSIVHVAETQKQVLESEEGDREESSNTNFVDVTNDGRDGIVTNLRETDANQWSHETSGIEDVEEGDLVESDEVIDDYGSQSSETTDHELQESVREYEESDLQPLSTDDFSVWIETTGEGEDGRWQEGSANQWYHEIPDNDAGGPSQVQDTHEDWRGNGLQEAIDSWLVVPSGEEAVPNVQVDSFYIPDDDNVYSMELRELLSRRRVSSLLRSGFRESLDRLVRSYVQRQVHASAEFEMDEASASSAFVGQDHEQQNDEQDDNQPVGAVRNLADISFPRIEPAQLRMDPELPYPNWSHHNNHDHVGTEWEVINELRIDMVRLQQRLNSMQQMLEECMDMQIELQRSVRQEVSAALNRHAAPEGSDELQDAQLPDETKWDKVRRGICCMCCDSNIDSLLYRCGHMCMCSKCAEKLVQQKRKCPMCEAPVIEVVRAYLTQ